MPLFRRRGEDAVPLPSDPLLLDYASRLRYIGRYLDNMKHRSIAILEVSGNFIVRSTDKSNDEPHLMEIVPEDFVEPVNTHRRHKVSPSSYEAMLSAIGRDLDERVALNIAIVEGPTTVQIVGWERGSAGDEVAYVLFDDEYDTPTLQRLGEESR